MKVLAADFIIPDPPVGPVGGGSYNTLGEILSEVWKYIIPLAGIIMMFMIIWGGFEMMSSGGSQEGIASGKSKITMGIIGFFVVFLAWFIIRALEQMFGLDILGHLPNLLLLS